MKKPTQEPPPEANQTVRLQIDTKDRAPSIRISFTDQRLTAHGGMIVWSHFLHQKGFRQQLREVLPHAPISPNAYDPTDVALGYLGGILCGADKLSRVAWLQSDPAIAEVLGIEAVASQSTLSRFFEAFGQGSCNVLAGLHRQAVHALPSLKGGYTLDLDSWALLHEDGHQEGVAVGYTRRGLKPCHRPLIAGLAEARVVAHYWLRSGNSACVKAVMMFQKQTSFADLLAVGTIFSSSIVRLQMFGLYTTIQARLRACYSEDHEDIKKCKRRFRSCRRPRPPPLRARRPQNRAHARHADLYLAQRQGRSTKTLTYAGPSKSPAVP